MNRALLVLVLCIAGVGLAGCVLHADEPLHGSGCAVPVTLMAVPVALTVLPLVGRLVMPPALARVPIRSVSLFQPPEPAA